MKPIQSYTHGILDYLFGLILLISPWLFGFHLVGSATDTMVTLGIIILFLSLITNYPLGLLKMIPFPTHGVLETIGAIFLLVSPWIVGFSIITSATWLAVIGGIAWLVVVAMTNYSYRVQRPVL